MRKTLALVLFLALPALAQQGPGDGNGPGGNGPGNPNGPGPGNAQIDVTHPATVNGEVVRYAGGPGLGQPTLTVKVGGTETPYTLGAYRYLVAQKFAPAAGDLVRLLLFPCANCAHPFVVAEVENLTQKTTLKLRNADGTPVFAGMGGMGRGGHGHRGGQGQGACGGTHDPATCTNPNCPRKAS